MQTVTTLDEEALRSELEKLQTAEFLYEKSLFPDLQYTLKHALTHEVAYGSLLQESDAALYMPVSWRLWKGSIATASPSALRNSPTMRCAVNFGKAR